MPIVEDSRMCVSYVNFTFHAQHRILYPFLGWHVSVAPFADLRTKTFNRFRRRVQRYADVVFVIMIIIISIFVDVAIHRNMQQAVHFCVSICPRSHPIGSIFCFVFFWVGNCFVQHFYLQHRCRKEIGERGSVRGECIICAICFVCFCVASILFFSAHSTHTRMPLTATTTSTGDENRKIR